MVGVLRVILLLWLACTSAHATSFAVLFGGSEQGDCDEGVSFITGNDWRDGCAMAQDGAECVCPATNWEVNGCSANCTIRVPIRNEGPDDIVISSVHLVCGDIDAGIPLGELQLKNKVPGAPIGEIAIDSIFTPIKGRRTGGNTQFDIELSVGKGRGYRAAEERTSYTGGTQFDIELTVGKGRGSRRNSYAAGSNGSTDTITETECPEGTTLSIENGVTVVPAYSEVLVEVFASIPENVRAILTVEDATGNASGVVLDFVETSVAEILNEPYLCCLTSVRSRVLLGTKLAEALTAYEEGFPQTALTLLHFFITTASTVACDASDTESTCLDQAIAAAVAAARLIAEEHGDVALLEHADSADYLRRRGEGEAAAVQFARTRPGKIGLSRGEVERAQIRVSKRLN